MIATVLTLAFLSAIAVIILMYKLDIRKFTGYSATADVVISTIFTLLFIGTFQGMVTALLAGIFVSIFLIVSKFLFGAKKLTTKGWKTL